jgi:outer membrane protein assembly factor BamE (lipoprotein component of BamABCDE complex)
MRTARRNRLGVPAIAVISSLALTACVGETIHRGYVPSETALQQVQVGAPREQVLIALGTPSTTAEFGGEVFYYISQTASRPVAFLNTRVVDQQVLAVYFDENSQVANIARYGLEDGQVIDLVTRTTPTGGRDLSFVGQLLGATGNIIPGAGGGSGPGPGP